MFFGLANSRSHWHTKYGTSYNFNLSRHILKAETGEHYVCSKDKHLASKIALIQKLFDQRKKLYCMYDALCYNIKNVPPFVLGVTQCVTHVTVPHLLSICLPNPDPWDDPGLIQRRVHRAK